MKKLQYTILLIVTLVLVVSCKNNVVKLGEVSYYPRFLWSAEKMDTLVRTYDFDFNADAKAEPSCFAEFTFVDNKGKSISQDELVVYVNGVKTENNTFRVNYNEESKELKFAFTPQAKGGKHQGYLKLTNHNLHIIDNQELNPNDTAQVFQWTIHYNKMMNPWVKALMWLAIAVIAALLVWFIFLRPALYPHFGKMTKTILVKQNGKIVKQMKFKFTGARKVIFANGVIKQPLSERIFIGKTITLIDPLYEDSLRFVPQKKGAMAFGNNYTVQSNPIPRSGVTTIKNAIRNIEITLN